MGGICFLEQTIVNSEIDTMTRYEVEEVKYMQINQILSKHNA
jgi:hypothetical protein